MQVQIIVLKLHGFVYRKNCECWPNTLAVVNYFHDSSQGYVSWSAASQSCICRVQWPLWQASHVVNAMSHTATNQANPFPPLPRATPYIVAIMSVFIIYCHLPTINGIDMHHCLWCLFSAHKKPQPEVKSSLRVATSPSLWQPVRQNHVDILLWRRNHHITVSLSSFDVYWQQK